MLFRYTTEKSGTWKEIDNEIVDIMPDGSKVLRFKPVSANETPAYMHKLTSLYNVYRGKELYDPLILIPFFILDFLCIHPFKDGNGRIARLLTLLLLYQAGYRIGKYISLERIVEESKFSYYSVLKLSSENWHEGRHDIFPLLEYFYGILIASYKDFESRVVIFESKLSKTDQVKAAVEKSIKPFSISEIEKKCPNVSRDMIRKIIRELRDKTIIKSMGIGRNAKWKKIVKAYSGLLIPILIE